MIHFLIVSVCVLSRNLNYLDFKTIEIFHYLNIRLDTTKHYLSESCTNNQNLRENRADSTTNMVLEKMCLY